VYVQPGGGNGNSIVALNKKTGEPLWNSQDDTAGYSSPVVSNAAGERQAIFLTGKALVSLHPDTGKLNWRYKWETQYDCNIATPLVLTLLAEVPAIERMLVMVQREVGERLAAGPGDAAYGIPSVKVALRATAEVVGRVPPTVFVPQPRVESALVRIVRRHRPAVDADPVALSRLVDAGFNQRRKMLRRSLSGLVDADGFAQAGVDPTARAETLTLHDWAALVPVAHAAPRPGAARHGGRARDG